MGLPATKIKNSKNSRNSRVALPKSSKSPLLVRVLHQMDPPCNPSAKYVCPELSKPLSPQGTRPSALNSLSPLSHSLEEGELWKGAFLFFDVFGFFEFFDFVEIPWEPHLVKILSESSPNGGLREESTPQPDALWEYHLVKIHPKSLPARAPRELQNTKQKSNKSKVAFPKTLKSPLLVRVLHQMDPHQPSTYALCPSSP